SALAPRGLPRSTSRLRVARRPHLRHIRTCGNHCGVVHGPTNETGRCRTAAVGDCLGTERHAHQWTLGVPENPHPQGSKVLYPDPKGRVSSVIPAASAGEWKNLATGPMTLDNPLSAGASRIGARISPAGETSRIRVTA